MFKKICKIVTLSKSDYHIFLSSHHREKNLIRRLQFCVVQKKKEEKKTHTHTVIILEDIYYKKKNFLPSEKKLEDLKEMFAQMKF